jgi:hypothetical protein
VRVTRAALATQAILFEAVDVEADALVLPRADVPRVVLLPAGPLAEALISERDKVRDRVRAARALQKIGDTREADRPCPACGSARIERLEDIAAEGGQTWVVMCVATRCARGRARNASIAAEAVG